MDSFSRATRTWFQEQFDAPTDAQRLGWAEIAAGRHALIAAPTGSGKTLAAFLWAIDRESREPEVESRAPGVRVLYVSPLKALVYDVERNLRAPLAGVLRTAERLGELTRPLRVDVRTGDTPQRERQRQSRDPGDILVTTPESLFLILGSRAGETLRTVHTVIIDEIHAVAATKRGTHLALSLERLTEICASDPQRVGLSATVRPLEDVARFLGGDRDVRVVDASRPPDLDVEIVVPVPDMEHVPPPKTEPEPDERGGSILGQLYREEKKQFTTRTTEAYGGERGLWPALYPELVDEIRRHRSTILFVNSRGLCERLAQRLNDVAGEELVLAHHGSVSHERRASIEDGLKEGRLRALVATSSLELGIDMGAVDRVVLIESPGSVARGLQRVGRAGHQVGETSSGAVYPKFRGDLLECAVVCERMLKGEIEELRIPRNPLDVLAQQLVAMCCAGPRKASDLARVVRRAQPYAQLSDDAFAAVLDMLSGRFPSTELADLRPRLRWDRATDLLSARRGTQMVSRLNAGTIPDRGAFAVHLGPEGPRLGELDEEMVYESRAGDVIQLGASSWRVEEITRDRVIVSPAPGEGGRLPFWKGEGPGRPIELGRALGAFVREVGQLRGAEAVRVLEERLPLARHAAENLAAYLDEQREVTGVLPTDRAITVERFRDELGDWRVCILTPLGARVHAPWAMALEELLAERTGVTPEVMYTDDGIVLRLADEGELPEIDLLFPEPEQIEELVTRKLGDTALFAGLFRENAVRSLLVTRRRPDQRTPLWAQRLKTKGLYAAVRGHASFPVVIETYRQALSDVFDLPELARVLGAVRAREIRVDAVETSSPSPFARSLVYAYVANYLYESDSPVAERRAQALTLDRALLRELLGEVELRELLDRDVMAEVEAELAGLAPERRARDRDELADLLRRVGDLTLAEARERCAPPEESSSEAGATWLAQLEDERRAIPVRIVGEERWIAADEAGLFRDALGCAPPGGLPSTYVEPFDDPWTHLVRRWARTHGPFRIDELARRFGVQPAQVQPVIDACIAAGTFVLGELRPGASGTDLCDAEVLRRIKRRTLARVRDEVAAVDGPTLARFLVRWHGLDEDRRGPERLEEVVSQLEGLALPWSSLAEVILPGRARGFTLDALDMLSATGRVVWVGCGARGPSDGRVALYRRERAAELLERAEPFGADGPPTPVHAAILDALEQRGASFLTALEAAAREVEPELSVTDFEQALWDLVWAGCITNDTFQPLRALARRTGSGTRRARPRRGIHPLAGGRWWLVRELTSEAITPTERLVARTGMLLERYGIVSREAALAEGLAGGFGPIYRTLRAMEDAGRVQRGWFVAGLSGAQFGPPGAVDRLRSLRRDASDARAPDVVCLPALDPANPFGTLLDWPPTAPSEGGKARAPRRVPGAWVVLVDGAPGVYVAPGKRHVVTFPSGLDTPFEGGSGARVAAFRALTTLPREGRRRAFVLETVDGVPVESGPHLAALLAAGFVRDYRGVVPDPSPSSMGPSSMGPGTSAGEQRAGG
ncbi:MAG: DEAD/DEAH box helicase [bacterium]|nr:DEAD/DEAH box helicase [bacterium]